MRRFTTMRLGIASFLSCLALLLGAFTSTGTASAHTVTAQIRPFLNVFDVTHFGNCLDFRITGGDFSPGGRALLRAESPEGVDVSIDPGSVGVNGNGNFARGAQVCADFARFRSCGDFIDNPDFFCGFNLNPEDFCRNGFGFEPSQFCFAGGFRAGAMLPSYQPPPCPPQSPSCMVPSNNPSSFHHAFPTNNPPPTNNPSPTNNPFPTRHFPGNPSPSFCPPTLPECQPSPACGSFNSFCHPRHFPSPVCRSSHSFCHPRHFPSPVCRSFNSFCHPRHFPSRFCRPFERFRCGFRPFSVFRFCGFHFLPFCFRFRHHTLTLFIAARDSHTGLLSNTVDIRFGNFF